MNAAAAILIKLPPRSTLSSGWCGRGDLNPQPLRGLSNLLILCCVQWAKKAQKGFRGT